MSGQVNVIEWAPDIALDDKPRYLAIADAIAEDISRGRLSAGDRLPPQRRLAQRMEIDFTTVARGYVEAQKRGLIGSTVGRGTFVLARRSAKAATTPRRSSPVDLSMNLPPEPQPDEQSELIERMQAGLEEVGRDLISLMRYQGFGGSPEAKDAATSWLSRRSLVPSQERLFVVPGAHAALLGIFSVLATPRAESPVSQSDLAESHDADGVRAAA
jgi:DNA-binding transcriptional MocR family regulator